jgi:Uma2 family endonuclease
MPTAVTELPPRAEPRRKLWTRAEVDALSSTGLFDQQNFELVEGELINTMGKLPPHVTSMLLLMKWLIEVFRVDFVRPESPINVAPEDNPTSEPQPDLVVLKRDFLQFKTEHPSPGDIHLVIEVSDSTLSFDLRTKAGLYARAGIIEYWVLDIAGGRMIVHRDPRGGRYASVVAYNAEECLAPLSSPESRLRVKDAFAR